MTPFHSFPTSPLTEDTSKEGLALRPQARLRSLLSDAHPRADIEVYPARRMA